MRFLTAKAELFIVTWTWEGLFRYLFMLATWNDLTHLFKIKHWHLKECSKYWKAVNFWWLVLQWEKKKFLTPKYVQYNWRASRAKWLATSLAVEVMVEGLTYNAQVRDLESRTWGLHMPLTFINLLLYNTLLLISLKHGFLIHKIKFHIFSSWEIILPGSFLSLLIF